MRRRGLLPRAFVLASLLLAGLLFAAPGQAVESYELAGTVTQSGCGGKAGPCAKLPQGERLAVAIDTASRVASVPVGRSGRWSIILPAGNYQATPGILGNGPETITRFSPESLGIGLNANLTAVDFTYEVAEPDQSVAELRFGGAVGDVGITTFSIAGHGAGAAKTVTAETEEPSAFAPLQRALERNALFPTVKLEGFKKSTHTRSYLLTLKQVRLDQIQKVREGAALRFGLVAREATLER